METPPSRLAARMRKLPHAVVADLAAEMACEEAEQAQRIADKCLAHHCPVPAWAVTDVLLSPDLLPVLLESLEADDCAAAAVCRRWRQSFLAAGAQRRKWCRVSTEDWQDGLVVRIDGKDIVARSSQSGLMSLITPHAALADLLEAARLAKQRERARNEVERQAVEHGLQTCAGCTLQRAEGEYCSLA